MHTFVLCFKLTTPFVETPQNSVLEIAFTTWLSHSWKSWSLLNGNIKFWTKIVITKVDHPIYSPDLHLYDFRLFLEIRFTWINVTIIEDIQKNIHKTSEEYSQRASSKLLWLVV